MKNNVKEVIEKYALLGDYNCVTVALSGGADSMALLYVLLSLKDELNIKVNAAHLNHNIRGEEALRDEKFVKETCKQLGVELFCESANIPKISKQKGISTELAARIVRYEFLERVATGLIATAHTASDNIETVLFNLSRGTALDGLCGIPVKRGRVIRPLLHCTRSQIEEYCKENSINFVTDSTNLEDCYTRNKIRHNVVSVLKEINPSVETAVLRAANSLKDDADFLENSAEEYRKKYTDENGILSTDDLTQLHRALQKRIIRNYINSLQPELQLETVHIEAVLSAINTNSKANLPQNMYAKVSNGKLLIFSENKESDCSFKVDLKECDADFVKNTEKINNLLLNNLLDCDKIVGKLIVRTRNAGDSVRLRNRGCTKSVNKILNENKVDLSLRDKVPVISDDLGVVWVYGAGVAHRCAANTNSKKVLVVSTIKSE